MICINYFKKIYIKKLSYLIVKKLIKKNEKIAFMESCTGGYLAHIFSNVPRSSNIFWGSAVTYDSEYKIKMGVNEKIIKKYSVYSKECAREMSKCIYNYSNASICVGVTGIINNYDAENKTQNKVNVSIYDNTNQKYYDYEFYFPNIPRQKCKVLLVINILKELNKIIG